MQRQIGLAKSYLDPDKQEPGEPTKNVPSESVVLCPCIYNRSEMETEDQNRDQLDPISNHIDSNREASEEDQKNIISQAANDNSGNRGVDERTAIFTDIFYLAERRSSYFVKTGSLDPFFFMSMQTFICNLDAQAAASWLGVRHPIFNTLRWSEHPFLTPA